MSGGGGAARPSEESAPVGRSISSRSVGQWIDAHNDDAATYALNPPDTININGITFNNITGEAIKSITGARTTDYTSNYQSSIQATNGEYPVVQVTVTETMRRIGGREYRVYNINKSKTKLW